jgi:hypothetical protein
MPHRSRFAGLSFHYGSETFLVRGPQYHGGTGSSEVDT